jgi:hypothetical protein
MSLPAKALRFLDLTGKGAHFASLVSSISLP